MCGIFAYCNYGTPTKQSVVVEKLLNGLRRLEYRGYDSAGIALDNGPGPGQLEPIVIREIGKIDKLADQVSKENLHPDLYFENHCGIGHTRWATHGPPAPRNSHPHTSDKTNEFLVVHNGIITNHQPLKEMLQRKGFAFESDTDTEVIPKLTKYLFDKFKTQGITFRQLVMEVVRQLQGAFALLFKSVHYPGELVAAKRGSPLLMGIVEPEFNGPAHAALASEGFQTSMEEGARACSASRMIEKACGVPLASTSAGSARTSDSTSMSRSSNPPLFRLRIRRTGSAPAFICSPSPSRERTAAPPLI